jgi:menaquinone-9 beta-reductase
MASGLAHRGAQRRFVQSSVRRAKIVKAIHIVGGGLAGLTLGILLRRRGVAVVVSEKDNYPRHRVCGEFVSGRGLDVLDNLSLKASLLNQGARLARTSRFFSGAKTFLERTLPYPALCVSRHVLDAALADEFVRSGGELKTGEVIRANNTEAGIVWATGRRAMPVDDKGARWVGLKVHARNVTLQSDLEMHLDRDTYIGMCRVSRDVVNVCGLFRCRAGEAVGISALRGRVGTALVERLQDAQFLDDSFCAVAGLSLHPQPIDPAECRIGDALTMIPPITGNGMSMAFESAAIAAEHLTRFAQDETSWSEAKRMIARELESRFASRLRWAERFHTLLFRKTTRQIALPLMLRSKVGWRAAFALTR